MTLIDKNYISEYHVPNGSIGIVNIQVVACPTTRVKGEEENVAI